MTAGQRRVLPFAVAALAALSAAHARAETKLPLTELAPASIVPNLCLVHYRISTASPECQALFDQGLGYFYSYVWMEASRSFETAVQKDPTCPMAWWGLSRSLDRWGRTQATDALKKAQQFLPHASQRERFLIEARLQEKSITATGTTENKRALACQTLDELLSQYDDDEEGWFNRAQATEKDLAKVPYYKALLRINTLHPGANHELLHYYEGCQRPALGWVYAENYIRSSPGIPHPFHMQAHLATRLGRWEKTSDRSSRAIELHRAYHKEMGVKPRDDYQFTHHLEILTLSLTHDGRFREAEALKKEASDLGYHHWVPWYRLYAAERNWDEALKIAEHFRKSDKVLASYFAALVYLEKGDPARAKPEVEVLRQAFTGRKKDRQLQFRLWEAQGLLLCHTGAVDGGLNLLAKAVEESKNDYSHHSWGNGAYYMEQWGNAALEAGKNDTAEEAFQEALAHDPGSVRAALGLQILCERLGRTEEARRYERLAHRCWSRAEVQSLDREKQALSRLRPPEGDVKAIVEKPTPMGATP